MKKSFDEILTIMNGIELKIGENCVEYIGFRDADNFINYLEQVEGYTFDNGIHGRVGEIWAYADVVWELDLDAEEEIFRLEEKYSTIIHDYYLGIDAVLTALYFSSLDEEKQAKCLDELTKQGMS